MNLIKDLIGSIEVLSFEAKDAEISATLWARLRERGYEVNDADIMISAVSMRVYEKLLTLDRDFELIRAVAELDVEVLGD